MKNGENKMFKSRVDLLKYHLTHLLPKYYLPAIWVFIRCCYQDTKIWFLLRRSVMLAQKDYVNKINLRACTNCKWCWVEIDAYECRNENTPVTYLDSQDQSETFGCNYWGKR